MKTFKREYAMGASVFLAAFCIWGVYEPEAQKVAEFLTWPILALSAGAFGLDSLAKQFGAR